MSVVNKPDEVCDSCGVVAELGSVIREEENVLILPLTGKDKCEVRAMAEKYVQTANAQFADCVATEVITSGENTVGLELSLTFSCTAEKLIYEMGLRHL